MSQLNKNQVCDLLYIYLFCIFICQLSKVKTFIGGAVGREYELDSEAPAAEEVLDRVIFSVFTFQMCLKRVDGSGTFGNL